jgi:hypothetical protein
MANFAGGGILPRSASLRRAREAWVAFGRNGQISTAVGSALIEFFGGLS